MFDPGVAELFDSLDAFCRCAGDREAVNEVIVNEIGIDPVFHRLHNVKASHEFYSFQLFGGTVSKVVKRKLWCARLAIRLRTMRRASWPSSRTQSMPAAMRATSLSWRPASRRPRRFSGAPNPNAQIEARSEYHAIRAAASEPQAFGSFRGNVNRHWMEIGNPDLTLGKSHRLSLNQIANHFDAGLEFIKRRCFRPCEYTGPSPVPNPNMARPLEISLSEAAGAGEDRRVTEYHVGDGDAQKHPFCQHRTGGEGLE